MQFKFVQAAFTIKIINFVLYRTPEISNESCMNPAKGESMSQDLASNEKVPIQSTKKEEDKVNQVSFHHRNTPHQPQPPKR